MEDKNNLKAIFDEITEHLLQDLIPSEYLIKLSQKPIFHEYPFQMLLQLKSTEQSKIHHPEGSVWNHTMLVLDEAAKVKNQSKGPIIFMWAALLHDIGKPATTRMRKGRITSYDHDQVGAKLSKEFLSVFMENDAFIQAVSSLVRYHMHMLYIMNNLPYVDMEGMKKEVDLDELALLCRCDRLGRTGAIKEKEEKAYKDFLLLLKQ